MRGLEPPRDYSHYDLNVAWLPITAHPLKIKKVQVILYRTWSPLATPKLPPLKTSLSSRHMRVKML